MILQKTKTWALAIRAETLIASICPMIIGTLLASKEVSLNIRILILTFLYGLLLHIGVNLSNDYYDYLKGADTDKRIAPFSTIQTKLTSLKQVKSAFIASFILAFIIGFFFIFRGGAIVAVLFTLPIIFGFFYTGGAKPLGYMGMGDILVLIFFGPFTVLGTYFLQTLTISYIPILIGLGPGFLILAILVVNNLRDIEVDRPAKKRTLAVIFGKKFTQIEYTLCLILALAIPIVYFIIFKKPFILITSIFLIFVPFKLIYNFKNPSVLNEGLKRTVLLLVIYTMTLCIGLI